MSQNRGYENKLLIVSSQCLMRPDEGALELISIKKKITKTQIKNANT
jgi:hypothetical protein